MAIIGNRNYTDQEVESVVLEDGTRIILMYEFWGG